MGEWKITEFRTYSFYFKWMIFFPSIVSCKVKIHESAVPSGFSAVTTSPQSVRITE
jgi:hypothetical protein